MQRGTVKVAPGWVVWLLIVLATIVGIGATLNTWVERQALDTDRWVSVTEDMLADDDVRAALSAYLVNELFSTVDVAEGLEGLLPDQAAPLAGPLAATLQANAVGLIDRALDTDQFRTVWVDVNRAAHATFVRVVRGEDGAVLSTSGGEFVIDLRELLVRVSDRLGLPDTVVDRIPADAGQFVVFDSSELDDIQQAVRVIDKVGLYLFLLVIVLYGAAVFVAVDRRVALRHVGLAAVVGSLLILLAQRVALDVSVDRLARAANARSAVDAIGGIVMELLTGLAWGWMAMGVLVVAYATVSGPSRVAVAVRTFIAPVVIKPAGAWALGLGMLVLYALLVPGFSIDRWVPGLVFAVLFVVGVELLRRQISREHLLAHAEP
jgi:hypothetical protein